MWRKADRRKRKASQLRSVEWIGSSLDDLRRFPKPVRFVFGQALFDAQTGHKNPAAKPLKGFGGAGVLEIVEDDTGGTYRAVYTVRFSGIVYVLHAFQKKSKSGSTTPGQEMEKVRRRLRDAERHYATWKERQS